MEDGIEIDVGDHEILGERAPARDALRALVEDDAAAVEDQLVLSPHHVEKGHADEIVDGASGQHHLAIVRLARVERRAVDRDDQFRTRQGLPARGTARIPDVLTDVHGERDVTAGEHGRFRARLEVSVLVEHAVVRQVLLVIDAGPAAVVQDRGRVEDVVALVDEAHHGGEAAGGAGDLGQRAQVRLDERRLEEQVLGRVAGDRQLGKGHQAAAERARLLETGADLGDVALEVPDRRVDLGEGDPVAAHGGIVPAGRGGGRIVNPRTAVLYAAFHEPRRHCRLRRPRFGSPGGTR